MRHVLRIMLDTYDILSRTNSFRFTTQAIVLYLTYNSFSLEQSGCSVSENDFVRVLLYCSKINHIYISIENIYIKLYII